MYIYFIIIHSYLTMDGIDGSLKIYDVWTYKPLQYIKWGSAANFLDFSQMGLLVVGLRNVVKVSFKHFFFSP